MMVLSHRHWLPLLLADLEPCSSHFRLRRRSVPSRLWTLASDLIWIKFLENLQDSISQEHSFVSIMSGYKLAAFDFTTIDEKLLCPSCGYVLCDAMQLGCGHHYCEMCLNNMQRQNLPNCLKCGKSLVDMERFADKFLRREILALNVFCKYKDNGCHWQEQLKLMDDHHNHCPCRPVLCRNENCNIDILAWKLTEHETTECDYRPVVCEYCNGPETFVGLQNHLTTCPNVPVQCRTCGKENIPQNQLTYHTDPLNGDCPRKPCPFTGIGCTQNELMTQDGLSLHFAEHVNEHLLLLQGLVEAQRHQNHSEALQPQVAGIRQDLDGAGVKLEDHDWALSNHYFTMEKLANDVKALVNAQAGLEATVAELKQENRELKEDNRNMKNRITELEMRANSHDDHDNTLNAQLGVARMLLSSLLRQFQEFSCQKVVQCGMLVWKISDVCRKCAEARGNPELFLLSPPFYSTHGGYKVCVRLYMNGHGHEQNSHLSFFFVLMKGDYDAILEWPFSHRVELKIMGQGNSRGDDVTVSFLPDLQSPSFAKPAGGMNIPHGVPQNAFPLDILAREGYVHDDTMFVKVTVLDR